MQSSTLHRREIDKLLPDEIPENTQELVPVKNNVKKWAAENAYLLIYIALVSMVGWVITVVMTIATT